MHRTLYEIFGLPPLNMFDALANDFSDCFTTQPRISGPIAAGRWIRGFSIPRRPRTPRTRTTAPRVSFSSVKMDDDEVMENVLRHGEKEATPR